MNDNEPWPKIGQAGNSPVVQALARTAGWRLTEIPADLGLPLAGCLYNEANDLLVTATDGKLIASITAMDSALVATRSDAIIVRTPEGAALPEFALGLWRSGRVTWHWLLALWVGIDAGLWLIPTSHQRDATAATGFRLTARHLCVEGVPWRTMRERDDGLVRANDILIQQEGKPSSAPTGAGNRL
jgi:hypothetical protein